MPFGQVINVTGAGNGFPGNYSRTADTLIVAWPVLPTTATNLTFGDGAVIVANASGGGASFQSFRDYLATPTNAATLAQYFAGVAVRNVLVGANTYSSYSQNQTTSVATTATQATIGASTIVVASATGIVVGQSIEGSGIQLNSLVTGISSTTITISLPTIGVLSTTNVVFTSHASPAVGLYTPGTQGEVLVRSSVTVFVGRGTPAAAGPVYVRTVANALYPGTFVGGFEAAIDASTTSITIGITAGSTALATSAGTGVAVGQQITGPGIAPNTYIVSGATTSWVMSQPALYTIASGGAASFNNTALLGSVVDPWITFRTGNIDSNDIAEIMIKNRHAA